MRRAPRAKYEAVIGLEVHTHLRTDSKLFSPAPVSYGDEVNHNVHAIDLGLPGVLPVLNESVVDLAIRLGLATHGKVNSRSVFARRNAHIARRPGTLSGSYEHGLEQAHGRRFSVGSRYSGHGDGQVETRAPERARGCGARTGLQLPRLAPPPQSAAAR